MPDKKLFKVTEGHRHWQTYIHYVEAQSVEEAQTIVEDSGDDLTPYSVTDGSCDSRDVDEIVEVTERPAPLDEPVCFIVLHLEDGILQNEAVRFARQEALDTAITWCREANPPTEGEEVVDAEHDRDMVDAMEGEFFVLAAYRDGTTERIACYVTVPKLEDASEEEAGEDA